MTKIMPTKDSQVPHCIGSYPRKIPTQSQSDRFTFMDLSNYVQQMWVKRMLKNLIFKQELEETRHYKTYHSKMQRKYLLFTFKLMQ